MPTPAGTTFAVLDPVFRWAFLKSVLPARELPYGGLWPAAWKDIEDTVNGAGVTFRNPRTAITGDRKGRLGDVPAGDDGVAIGLDNRLPTMEFLAMISYLESVVTPSAAAVAEVASLTISAAPTANGDVTVTLDGVATAVAVVTTDTADGVATKIRNTAFAGWTTGGSGATVTFTATTAGAKAGANSYSAGTTGVTGTMSTTTEGSAALPELGTRHLRKSKTARFMLGFEGLALEGSLFDVDTMIRGICYCASNTANAEHVWRSTGADAVVHANVTLEALPSSIDAAMLTGTNIPAEALDPDGKFDYFEIAA
jgi:hypothetical protein